MRCETLITPKPVESSSEAARQRLLSIPGEPLFLADWLRVAFIHYEVPAQELQSCVPFKLDLFEDKACVSLVAFTMRRMRPRRGGRLAAWLLSPFATNDYLNVRTYVHHRGEPGIYFLTEWMNNPFSLWLGPLTFGLPYRFGELKYHHRHEAGALRGAVRERSHGASFAYQAELTERHFSRCSADSLDEFLLERYTAFTCYRGKRRLFRIWHPPWPQIRLNASVSNCSLISEVWPWFARAQFLGAHYSPGAQEVWMGRPHPVPA